MPNVTIALNEKLLDDARSYAEQHGTTLNGLIRELLEARTQASHARRIEAALATLEELQKRRLSSAGWRWNRDEIYDDEILR